MKRSYLIAVVLLAFLAVVFTSCAGNKKIVKTDDTLATDLDAAQSKISDLEGQVKAKDQTIQDLEMQITAKDEEISNLQSELAMSEQEARDLEIQIVSREEEIASLEESMSTLQVDVGDETSTISQLNNRKMALEREVVSLKSQLDEVNARNADLESEIANLQAMQSRDKDRMSMTRDELIASLEREIEEKTIEIQQYKDALTINIVDQLFFDSGKATIKKEGLSVLDRIAEALKQYDDKVIRIEGHTDDVSIGPKIRGKFASNWELGAARASAVVRYFIDKHDMDPAQLIAVSFSKYRPIVPNISDDYRSKNRRIEIVLTQRALYEMMEIEESSIE
jgi:chemotaxis protein MotB